MTINPAFHFHIRRDLNISKTAERLDSAKQPAIYDSAGIRIRPVGAVTGLVNFDLFSGSVLENIFEFCFLQSVIEMLFELCQLISLLSGKPTLINVFFP